MKHTERWSYESLRFNNDQHEDKVGSIVDEEDFVIAEICGDAPDFNKRARLIAAAPEMLSALYGAKALLQFGGIGADNAILANVIAAITKATGGTE